MTVQLPPALAMYFRAEDAAETDVLERCFAPDAVVRDEGQVMLGLDAIKAWKVAAQGRYQYRVESLEAVTEAMTATVRAKLTGNFPGSPVELLYRFGLAADKITSLEIH